MKRLLLFFILFLNAPVVFSADALVKRLENKPAPEFVPPPITEQVLENGIKVYFLENKELPVFEISAMIKVGTVDERSGELGLSALMMAGLETGGVLSPTLKLSGDEVDTKLEDVAAEISSQADKEYSLLKLKCLINDVDVVLPLFFGLLQHPAFDQKKLDLVKTQMTAALKERNEKPMSIANREFLQQLYGEGSPWARVYSEGDLRNLTREKVLQFYRSTVGPSRVRLAVSGNLSWNDALAKIQSHTVQWKDGSLTERNLDSVTKEWKAQTYLIHKPSNQSSVIVGHFGDKRFSPDKYPMILANHLLGGSTFGSRLGNRIRTELGLAYSVSSRFGFETDYGPFQVFVGTKSESTAQVIREIKSVITGVVNGVISEQELKNSKNTILNQLIFQYENPFEIVSDRMIYDFYGYPPDYLMVYQKEIKEVTLKKVKAAAKSYLTPEKLMVMVVGDSQKVGDIGEGGDIEVLPLDDH